MIRRIISGGQTGADQGALFAARSLGIETGGTAPKGWRTQAGPAPWLAFYGLVTCDSVEYRPRTWKNVHDSTGTLIFGDLTSPGCSLTMQLCTQLGRPWIHVRWFPGVDVEAGDLARFRGWLRANGISTLNVAGNREERAPGISVAVGRFLGKVLQCSS